MTTYTYDERIVSDLYKDAYGYRPREYFWAEWNNSTEGEKQVIWDRLCGELSAAMAREEALEAEYVQAYREEIEWNMRIGAKDEYQAKRWFVQSLKPTESDLMYGGEWVCYKWGLPYGMRKLFDQVCRELLQQLHNEEL